MSVSGNGIATKTQPQTPRVDVRCRCKGKDGLLPSQESRGASFVGDVGAPVLFVRALTTAAPPSIVAPKPRRKGSSPPCGATIPHHIHKSRATRRGRAAGYRPADESTPRCLGGGRASQPDDP